ncbi:SDR family NAD(P)-dependent oxidoreductase [Sedimentitalea nanhaiensis]|uniref:Short chain dehydrogenase n=1 Tax=Sedimentitalea nanhaiensis TaxID=999627 RepID=A0A1I7DAV0_9RHOB|nr:SDR family NAD(P)-dependent oxidoreductase [Sedimentitalea nanhaiensis]SFU08799.1 short chain dehydrogenase [Sedimentitalea nanhaiensis]
MAQPIALITGGAQGIGLACGEALAEQGHRVVLADIKAEAVREAAHSLGVWGSWIACRHGGAGTGQCAVRYD